MGESMTTKERAIRLLAEKGCTYEVWKGDYGAGNDCTKRPTTIEIDAPDGFKFDGELHALVCFDWADVIDRLTHMTIEKCPADCECGMKP